MSAGSPSGTGPTDGLGPWQLYLCRACGLIYDEALGDPDGGLPPGMRFDAIPDDWVCPVCGVGKADFEPYVRRARARAPAPAAAPARRPGIVVVGAGLAGWGVAEALRALDGGVPITLVTACDGDRYHKPELSVALARGLSADGLRRETGPAAAERLGIRLLAHTAAVGLSPASRRLRTTRGTLRYAGLVLALGARPVRHPSLPPELCWRINDLAAWDGLHRALTGGPRRVVVVGMGLVGCELAEDLARAGHAATLIGLAGLPLADLLPEPAGRRVAAGLSGLGIALRGDETVTGLSRLPTGAIAVALASGSAIEADVVISATGLSTEARLVRAAGLAFDRGIAVDPVSLRTSAPDVYALGDCVSLAGVPCRYVEPVAAQAEVIAHALLDRPHPGYRHAHPVIRLKTRSAPVVLHGLPRPGAPWHVIEDGPDRLVMEQRLDGAVAARLVA